MKVIAVLCLDHLRDRWGEGIERSVVLSNERIGHIMEKHPGAYEQYGQYISQTIEYPDYVLEDVKNANTAMFIRRVDRSNLNVVIKLAMKDNAGQMKSSVITMYPMSDKRLRRMLNKAIVVYKATQV